jgi:hypothetical protein
LLGAVAILALSRQYGLSTDAIYRHINSGHTPAKERAALIAGSDLGGLTVEQLREREGTSLLANLIALRNRLFNALDLGERFGDVGMVARAAAQLHENLALTGRLVGQLATSSSTTINNILMKNIADKSAIQEFWITDPEGHAYLTNTGLDFTFSPDAAKEPQASAFWPLLNGSKDVVIQGARKREIDDQIFKYVGVAGVDKLESYKSALRPQTCANSSVCNEPQTLNTLLHNGQKRPFWRDSSLGQLAPHGCPSI